MHRYSMILLLSCWCATTRPLAAQTFLTSTAYEAGQPVYGMAAGEIDPNHPGQEVAVLLADGSYRGSSSGLPSPGCCGAGTPLAVYLKTMKSRGSLPVFLMPWKTQGST